MEAFLLLSSLKKIFLNFYFSALLLFLTNYNLHSILCPVKLHLCFTINFFTIMNKNNQKCRLSYFKKLVLLRRFREPGCPVLTGDEAKALLNSLSDKQFKKLYDNYSGRFDFLSKDVLAELLLPANEQKFQVLARECFEISAFCNAIIEKGNKEQILALLSCKAHIYGDILIEQADTYFVPFVKKKGLPHCVFMKLMRENREDLVLTYFKETCFSLHLSDYESLWLFTSPMEQAKDFYLQHCSDLDVTARIYAYKHKDDALCLKIADSYYPVNDDEWKAVFKRINHSILVRLIEKMNAFKKSDGSIVRKDLNNLCEVLLMESGLIPAIRLYLPQRELCDKAETALVKTMNRELIMLYLKEGAIANTGLCATAEELLFAMEGMADIKSFYEDKFGLSYTKEKSLIESGDEIKIMAYTAKFRLFNLNAARLMKSKSVNAALAYCQAYELPEIAQTVLMKEGHETVRRFYIDNLLKKGKELCPAAEKYFIKNGTNEQITAYAIDGKAHLCPEAAVSLLNRKDEALTQAYDDKKGLQDKDLALFAATGKKSALCLFFVKHDLPENGEKALIKRNDPDLLIAYFERYDLHLEAEKDFIQSDLAKTYEALLFYVDKYDLFEANEVILFRLGDRRLTDTYVAKHSPCVKAERILVANY